MINPRALALVLSTLALHNTHAMKPTKKTWDKINTPLSSSQTLPISSSDTEKKEKAESTSISAASSSASTSSATMPVVTLTTISKSPSMELNSQNGTVEELELSDGFFSKLGNYFTGTDQKVLAQLRTLGENQVLKQESVINQKVLTSAVINLLTNNNPQDIMEFIKLSSRKKCGHVTAAIDKTSRRSLRKWLKDHRGKQDEELSNFYHKQAEALKQEYEQRTSYNNIISDTIDQTYEVGGESDNEEEHPSYVEKSKLIKIASSGLSIMKPSTKSVHASDKKTKKK